MGFFNPQQAMNPAMLGGGSGIPPEILQMIMQQMQGGGAMGGQAQMPMGGMSPVNVPQQGLMPEQVPQMGPGPSAQMNPLASILGNQGGAMSPQGGMDNGSAGGGNGMGGLMQIINAIKSQQQVNGQQPMGRAPGGVDIMAIINAMKGGKLFGAEDRTSLNPIDGQMQRGHVNKGFPTVLDGYSPGQVYRP